MDFLREFHTVEEELIFISTAPLPEIACIDSEQTFKLLTVEDVPEYIINVKDITLSVSVIYPQAQTITASYILVSNKGNETQRTKEISLSENLTGKLKTYNILTTDMDYTFTIQVIQGYYSSISNITVLTSPISAKLTTISVQYSLNKTGSNSTSVLSEIKTTNVAIEKNDSTSSRTVTKSITDKGITQSFTFTQEGKIDVEPEYIDNLVFYVPLHQQTKVDVYTNTEGKPWGNSTATWDSNEGAYLLNATGSGTTASGLTWDGTTIENWFNQKISYQTTGYTVAVYAKFVSQTGNWYSHWISVSSGRYSQDGHIKGGTCCNVCPARYIDKQDDSGWHWYAAVLQGTTIKWYRDKNYEKVYTGWRHVTTGVQPKDVSLCDINLSNTNFQIYVKDARVYNRVLTQQEIATFAPIS